VRQQNDPLFENLLYKIRLKTVKGNEIELLRTRLSKNIALEEKKHQCDLLLLHLNLAFPIKIDNMYEILFYLHEVLTSPVIY
jgi:hypothetical protein